MDKGAREAVDAIASAVRRIDDDGMTTTTTTTNRSSENKRSLDKDATQEKKKAREQRPDGDPTISEVTLY